MITIALCDDNTEFREQLRAELPDSLEEQPLRVSGFSGIAELTRALEEGFRPQIAIMDIDLKDGNGIVTAKRCFPVASGTQVIFLTGHAEFCTEVYETEHVYFLLKPIRRAQLARALEKAAQNLTREEREQAVFKTADGLRRVSRRSIVYLESQGHKVFIHCAEGTLETGGTLAQIAGTLGDDFLPCHKSFLVNLARVERLRDDGFHMDDGSLVPVSRAGRKRSREGFYHYIGEKI